MAIYEIFSHPIKIQYKTSLCSKATLFYIISTLLIFIPPLLITYRSQGFWVKTNVYREQPEVHFKHQMLLILETKNPEKKVVWTSFSRLNKLLKSGVKSRIPTIQQIEEDVTRDGKNDKLQMQIEVPVTNEEVISVKLLMIFDYKLYLYSLFQMESLIYIEHSSPLAGGALHVIGELGLHQREPLWHRGQDTRYNKAVIDESTNDFDVYKLENILKLYSERNVTTILRSPNFIWISGRSANEPFRIELLIHYPEETILYRVGFWQLIKWGWVQYVALLALFWFVISRIKLYVFENQLVPTIIFTPRHC